MTIAAVLTVAVSLTLVGAALLLRQGAANATGPVGAWHPGHGVDGAGRQHQEIHAVGTQLTQLNYVRQPCAYWDKAAQLHRGPQAPALRRAQATTEAGDADLLLVHPGVLSDANQLIPPSRGHPGC